LVVLDVGDDTLVPGFKPVSIVAAMDMLLLISSTMAMDKPLNSNRGSSSSEMLEDAVGVGVDRDSLGLEDAVSITDAMDMLPNSASIMGMDDRPLNSNKGPSSS